MSSKESTFFLNPTKIHNISIENPSFGFFSRTLLIYFLCTSSSSRKADGSNAVDAYGRDASDSPSPGVNGEAPAIRGQVRIKQLLSEEIRQVIENSHKDRQLGELVSLVESVLLDVDQGEVIRSPGYDRDLLAVCRRRPISSPRWSSRLTETSGRRTMQVPGASAATASEDLARSPMTIVLATSKLIPTASR